MQRMTENNTTNRFIHKWQGVSASELSTSQTFLLDLCGLLDVQSPFPTPEQDYMFERPITFQHPDGSTSPGRVDLYRRGHFVLESKKQNTGTQTKGFDLGLLRAHSQADGYVRALPASEGRPPFLLVVDVGTVIEVYSEFSRSGGTYTPFPDPRSHRITLAELARPELLERLHHIWVDPETLNPARISAEVTRAVSQQLATLARSLEQADHGAQHVSAYLTRCLFSMFAEDVALLPEGAFLSLLQKHRTEPATLQPMLRILWNDMDKGGFTAALLKDVLRFNGKLFKGSAADGYSLLLTTPQIDLLILAAKANWREVEPAIFGTLLERALDPAERHALGAHYTPRAYVERLVLPTVMEPLRAEWANAQAAALLLAHEATTLEGNAPSAKTKADFEGLSSADSKALDIQSRKTQKDHDKSVAAKWTEARQHVKDFHHRLCTLHVLDPACGSANFLYVTLEHLKRLEGEVLNQFLTLGEGQSALEFENETVSLQQLRGIEINPRAAALAELVLWIGYLQWQIRTFGTTSVGSPVVHDFGNIEQRDAVLAFDAQRPMLDANGVPLTRWDGLTTKTHPTTGQQVPDEAAQVVEWRYTNPRPALWPAANFIVGNPPFIGNKRMRDALGSGYADALRAAWPAVPESADFVMYWWHKAAETVRTAKAERFGLITTNSLTMIFNRRVIEAQQNATPPLNLAFAIPDHPWVDGANGAAVRIAMTVGTAAAGEGRLLNAVSEELAENGELAVTFTTREGLIHADLKVGANIAAATKLLANRSLSSMGMMRAGAGFVVTEAEARTLGLGSIAALDTRIRPFRNGKDLTNQPRDFWLIDLFGLTIDEVRQQFPAVFQWVRERVKPERDMNRRNRLREQWWTFGESRQGLRAALKDLPRYIATAETAKHRVFQWLDISVLPDHKLVAIASDDALHLGVLSSAVHKHWALTAGGRLGVGNDPVYSKSTCFETFPFPSDDTGLTPALTERIRNLAEQIDAHRKARQTAHADATITGMYNVLEKIRNGEALTTKDKTINDHALVGVLQSLHDELDSAVLQAYGWADLKLPADTETLLIRLVDLNTRRAAEEATGTVRWLRPSFQHASGQGTQASLDVALETGADRGESGDSGESDDNDNSANGTDTDTNTEGGKAAGGSSNTRANPARNAAIAPQPWPSEAPAQIKAVADVLAQAGTALTLDDIAASFTARGRWRERLPGILDLLVALGRARPQGEAAWVDVGR
jgi:hypothetical protein